jgi:hypothetical protein
MILTAGEIRRVAVLAFCDPRTVARYLRGDRVQPLSAERIRLALDSLGNSASMRSIASLPKVTA